MDRIDRQLIEALQRDCSASVAAIAQEIGAPLSTVNDRIKRLQRDGIVNGFHAHIDYRKLGLDLTAFIFVGWADPSVEAGFIEGLGEMPEILECHHVTGPFNYLLKVRVRHTADLEALLSALKNRSGIQRTETMIVFSSPKETSFVAVPEADADRGG